MRRTPSASRMIRRFWSRLPKSNSASSWLSRSIVASLTGETCLWADRAGNRPSVGQAGSLPYGSCQPPVGYGGCKDHGVDHVQDTSETGDGLRSVFLLAVPLN